MTLPSGPSSAGTRASSPGPVPLPVPKVPAPKFADAARTALADTESRRNLAAATAALRGRRAAAAAGAGDWEELRDAGQAIKDQTLLNLDAYLLELERAVTAAGGAVHWAADAAEAGRAVTRLVRATGQSEVLTVRSPVTREVRLEEALARAGVTVRPAGLADLVLDLEAAGDGDGGDDEGGDGEGGGDGDGGDRPSHPLFPAMHRDPARIREVFARRLPDAPAALPDAPGDPLEAARAHLRGRALSARTAVCGAGLLVAETGTVVLLDFGGGAGRASLTLPGTLIAVAGIEEIVPNWADLEVFLQLLPASAAGEPMACTVSTWTGVSPGDGPAAFHLVLVDNGRTAVLADEAGRAALRCVRCSACLDVCPVYERTGGAPYGPVHPGPIGAVLTPYMRGVESAANASLPYASTLCGACADVCPVRIDIPDLLVRLRGAVVESRRRRPVPTPELAMMRALAWTMGDRRRYEAALRRGTRWARLLSRGGRIRRLPGLLGKWTDARDVPAPPEESFRAWWRSPPGERG